MLLLTKLIKLNQPYEKYPFKETNHITKTIKKILMHPIIKILLT